METVRTAMVASRRERRESVGASSMDVAGGVVIVGASALLYGVTLAWLVLVVAAVAAGTVGPGFLGATVWAPALLMGVALLGARGGEGMLRRSIPALDRRGAGDAAREHRLARLRH